MKENPDTEGLDKDSYLILEGREHDGYSYPDLEVCMRRLGYQGEQLRAIIASGLSYAAGTSFRNTAVESSSGKPYIGNIVWETALLLNLSSGFQTFNLKQFIDFLSLLDEGRKGRRKVYNARGNIMDSKLLEGVWDEIAGKRSPWRGEWLDAVSWGFNGRYINYDHRVVNKRLVPQKSEPVEESVREYCHVDLFSANRQGLPRVKCGAKEFYYYPPTRNYSPPEEILRSTASFIAHSEEVRLCFGMHEPPWSTTLGVREVRVRDFKEIAELK